MFTLGLCTFVQGLDNDESIGNRLGYAVTLILADIATVQLVFANTQFIGYWTILDYYIYSCFTFLYLVIVWSAVAIALVDSEHVNDVDFIMFWVFAGACFLLHCYFVYQARSTYKKERTKLDMTSRELMVYFEGTVAFDEQYSIAVMGKPHEFLKSDFHTSKRVEPKEDNIKEDPEDWNIYTRGEQASLLNS